MPEPLWRPSKDAAAAANITAFMARVEHDWGIRAPDYQALYDWSIHKPEEFWPSLWAARTSTTSRHPRRLARFCRMRRSPLQRRWTFCGC